MEKADILEMTVKYLRSLNTERPPFLMQQQGIEKINILIYNHFITFTIQWSVLSVIRLGQIALFLLPLCGNIVFFFCVVNIQHKDIRAERIFAP